jgi:rare lipoprotein A
MRFILSLLPLIVFFSCGDNQPLEVRNGEATYYGDFFHGKTTKSGDEFDMNDNTAAHATYPMGTKVRVTNDENNKSVVVEINDRPRTNNRNLIDLSKGAFKKISDLDSGRVKVKLEVLSWGEESKEN